MNLFPLYYTILRVDWELRFCLVFHCFIKMHNKVILTSLKIQFYELIYAISLRYDHIIVIESRKTGCTSVHCTSHCSSLHLSHLYCFIVVQKWLCCYVFFDYQVPLFCINQCYKVFIPLQFIGSWRLNMCMYFTVQNKIAWQNLHECTPLYELIHDVSMDTIASLNTIVRD